VKYSKTEIMSRAHKIPDLKFEDQNLTSFAGLFIFQPLMLGPEIKNRLFHWFRHLKTSRIFGHHIIAMLLIVHPLLGYQRLQDLSYYQDDPMVKRLLGFNQLPDPSTVARPLIITEGMSIERRRELCRKLVIESSQWSKFQEYSQKCYFGGQSSKVGENMRGKRRVSRNKR
jgi:hypothetical protein